MNPDAKNTLNQDTEPTVSNHAAYLPMWLAGLMAFLLYWGCNYVDARGGGYNQLVQEPFASVTELATAIPPDEVGDIKKRGLAVYNTYCAACHQATGLGNAGQAPPLAGSEWVTSPGVNRLIRIPQVGVTGPIKVAGTEWNMTAMIGFAATVSDEDMAALLTFIRNSWGNKASIVTPEQVAKVRAELKKDGKDSQYTGDELLKLPENL